MNKIFGYARISRPTQSIDRQIRSIRASYPDADIRQEVYTGTKSNRPQWQKLLREVKTGDTIVFDSVSRMSRNAEDGVQMYFELYGKGVQLVFLKEHHIDTAFYEDSLAELEKTCSMEVHSGDTAIDKLVLDVISALREFQKEQLRKQIQIAFGQSEKEVSDLHQRTKEGIETARRSGKQIGGVRGQKRNVKKAHAAKEVILKYSRTFGGSYDDDATRHKAGVASNTYYKYKRELKEEYPDRVVR